MIPKRLSRNDIGMTWLGWAAGQIVIRQGCNTPDEIAMWTPTTRQQHSRAGLRYGSDLTDAEWEILAPFLPAEAGCGHKRTWPMREIVNAICYILRGGVTWRLLPAGFPPWRTVYRWFARFRDEGVWEGGMGDDQPPPSDAGPRAGGARSQSDRDGDRQPERQDHREGRLSRLRRRQEDQGAQAQRPGRDRWKSAETARARGRYPGPGRGWAAAAGGTCALAIREACLHRRGVSGPEGRRRQPDQGRNRAQSEGSGWLRRPPQAVGGRAVLRLDQPQSPPRQRLRSYHQIRRGVPLRRIRDPAPTQVGTLITRFETDSNGFRNRIGRAYTERSGHLAIRRTPQLPNLPTITL